MEIKSTQTIRACMSPSPVTILSSGTVHQAACLMFEHKIRHLPVMRGDEVVGVVSDGDVAVVHALPGIKADKVSVSFAMTSAPFLCSPDDGLLDVVRHLREKKIGSALVIEDGQLVGIFSVIDALRVFEMQLEAA